MARTRIDTVVVPAGLVRLRIVIDEETAAVFLGEDAGESPRGIGQISDVEQVNDQEVAGLSTFDGERTTQIMHFGQVNIADIVCAVVVRDLPPGPIKALDTKFSTRLKRLHHGNVRMPAIVSFNRGIFWWPLQIKLERSLRHDDLLIKGLCGAGVGAQWLSALDTAPGATRIGRATKGSQFCEKTSPIGDSSPLT